MVSGTIALMLEANPNLTARDVQHILVKTAQLTDVIKDTQGNIQPGKDWTKNQAGYWFNDKYGFGVVDVAKAVSTAASWKNVEAESRIESTVQGVNDEIPNGTGELEPSIIKIDQDLTVEKVEVELDLQHQNWADLKVVLTSPDGTQSILAQPSPSNDSEFQPDLDWWKFTSVLHWGESSKGEWKLQVFDEKGNEFRGEWNAWKLNIYGTKPTVTVSATDSNASESGDPGEFTITRTGNPKNDLIVNYSLAGIAKNGKDYNGLTGRVVIEAGKSTATVPINPIDDAEYEGDETVVINLNPNNAYNLVTDSSSTVTIADNDLPTVTITATDSKGIEDGNAGQFVVTRTGNTAKPLTVNYSIAGNAINGKDYSTLIGSITIPAGAAMTTIPIIPLADAEVEGNETVEISLSDNAAYNIGIDKSGMVTIENRTDASQYGPFVYTNPANGHLYILSQPDTWLGAQEQAKALGGNLVTINDAAENNWLFNTFGTSRLWIGLTDSSIYGTTEGNFKWVSGKPVTYTNWHKGNPDNVKFTPEGEDFVHINQEFDGTWNDLGHDYLLFYGIIEIDPANITKPIVTIRATDAKAGEDGNAGQLIVSRIGKTTEPLTVNYSVFGNAINGTDYKNLTGSITIPTGTSVVSIPIIPIADNELEGNETVAVKLLGNDIYNVGASETATVTIANSNTLPASPSIYTNPATGNKYFLTKPDTWLGAQNQAVAVGGNLVTINDSSEQNWLVNTFGNFPYWIGLTDSEIYGATEGSFKWVSGEPVTYTHWHSNNPSNSLWTPNGEDFGEINREFDLWNDLTNDWLSQSGIVEIKANFAATNLTTTQTYTENIPLDLTDIVITDPDGQATVTLTLSNPNAGKLTTGTAGTIASTASTYDPITGVWQASGGLIDLNALLADIKFIPTQNFNQDLTINVAINDDIAAPLSGTITLKSNQTNAWIRQLGTSSDDRSHGMAVDSIGNVYIAGLTFGSLDGNVNGSGVNTEWADPFITKYDPTGTKLWTRQFGSSGFDYYNAVTTDNMGNAYTVGYDDRSGTVGGAVSITKWDNNGNNLWRKFFDTPVQDSATGVITDSAGNVYLTGTTDYSLFDVNRDSEIFIAKYDSSGNQIWTREFGTIGQDQGRSIAIDDFGNLYIAGVTEGSLDGNTSAGGIDVFLTKYDLQGNKIWTRQLGSAASDGYVSRNINGQSVGEYRRNVSVAVDNSGNVYISGSTEGSLDGNTNAGGQDAFVSKYDSNGNRIWTRQLGTPGNDRALGAAVDNTGKVYITGYTNRSLDGQVNLGDVDAFVTQYDINGNKLSTRLLGTSTEDWSVDIVVDRTGNFYTTGQTKGTLANGNNGNNDAWVSKNSVFTNTGQIFRNPANGHRYFLTRLDTWTGAQNRAVASGGNLVTINDAAEQDWLIKTFGSIENLYIGLTDSTLYGATEGEFKWVSGQPVTYTNWVLGEPNNGGNTVEQLEGFVHLYNLSNGKWNDTTNQGPWAKPARGIVEIE